MPVLNPDHLLDQADRLIASTGSGARRQADLRRAISNAYYALFHAIVTEAADDFVGSTHRTSNRYTLVYRSIEHKGLRTLCEHVLKEALPSKYARYAPQGGFGADLIAFAAAVIELYEKRHLADYDPQFRASTSDAILSVSKSRTALARLRTANRVRRRMFVSLLVFSPR
jgi:hypothetical protein